MTESKVMFTTLNQASAAKAIIEAVGSFWKDFLGWNPAEVNVFLPEGLIIVSLRGTLTPAEQKMAATSEGRMRIKRLMSALLDEGCDDLLRAIATSTQSTVNRTFTDIHVFADEQVFVFIFESKTVNPKRLSNL